MISPTTAPPTDATTTSRRRRARTVTQRASVLIAVGAMAATAPILAPVAGAASGSDRIPTASTGAAATATGWSEVAPMSTQRAQSAVAALADGRVLAVGGWDGTRMSVSTASPNFPRFLSSSEIYDPAVGTWQAGPKLPAPVWHATATTLTSGKVLVAGGGTSASYLFDPATETWQTGPTMPAADNANFAARLANGRVIVVGNYSTAEYNPHSNKWTALARPTWTQLNDTATILPNGDIVAAGRMSATTGPSVYKRATNTWTALPAPPIDPGYGADVVALPNGNVMVGGGSTLDQVLFFFNPVYSVMEVNPATGTWTVDPSIPHRDWTGQPAVDGSDFVLLSNGSVLATGGDWNGDIDYVYTPATMTWASTPGRDAADLSLLTLNDGSLMSVGGNSYGHGQDPTATAAIFHP